uniref:Uncharacterized protein n=2 Tax=Zea mays TaxID=4577 RepID=A0A804NP02_MAIZE
MAPFYLAPQPNTTLASSNSPRHRETLSSAERTYSAASSEVADIDDDDRTGYTFTTSAGFLIELRRPIRMNKKKRRRRRQQQGGRPVLVTFYVTQPRDRGGSTASSSSHHHHHNRQERHDDHHRRSHGGSGGRPGMQRRRRNDGKAQSGDRRADLLEYSRQLRALARQTASATTPVSSIPPPPPPRCRDTDTIMAAVGVHSEEQQGAPAVNHRLGRAMSQQQQVRPRCFGGDGWSWKKVLVLVLPSHSESRRPRRSNRDDSEKNVKINQTGRAAASSLLVGKLTVCKGRRDRSGLLKPLMSLFQKRPR